MKPFLYLLAFLLLCPTLSAQIEVFNLSVGQIDFLSPDGEPLVPNSRFGYIEVDVIPHPEDIYYLNVVAEDINRNPVWIVQNYPILPTQIAVTAQRKGMDFDIALLGLEPGQQLPEVNIGFMAEPNVATEFPPVPPPQSFVVNRIPRIAFGGEKMGALINPTIHSFPLGVSILFPITDIIKHDSTAGVQEDVNKCLAGSLARSIDWLNRKHGLGSTKTAQQWYDCLVKAGVSSDSTTYAQDIEAKDSLLKKLDSRGRTKIRDNCKAIGPTDGVPQDSGDVVKFLCEELPNRDVELHYDTHIVTVTGKFKVGPFTYICYRDDETQGDNSKGDKAEKLACIFQDTTGKYFFRGLNGGGFWKIKLLISEYIDTTSTFIQDGLLAGLQLRAYPNPGRGHYTLAINSPQGHRLSLRVLNLQGQLIQQQHIQLRAGDNRYTLDLTSYPAGLYLLQLAPPGGKGAVNLRIQKE
ncbi:MAG: T9SS C-terminal target domain-containing protein [Bacteroidetes bacterium]|nr:MAG: T9SS C-terminal target domain-containing protein [Bacteroidota bacterium]